MKIISDTLPKQLTPFIGRQHDLEEISRRLIDPNCRLLTLVGPGGMGKTRLAVEIARLQLGDFADGVAFVGLLTLDDMTQMIPAIANSVQLQFYEGEDVEQQLFDYLQPRDLLLVLDNFEHLLVGASLVTDLLRAAPRLTILVTSREPLNLQEEWIQRVEGMSFPKRDDDKGISEFSAVRLFEERARQVNKAFDLQRERKDVLRICKLTDGMPLAIELAAAWHRMLPVRDVADEIEQNLDFLETNLRNVPERHRSVRAVFDYSWSLLGEREQDTFKKLSVFRGAFSREAAKTIAGASLPTMGALVDKSLLTLLPDGYYAIHELLRQYATDFLETGEREQLRDSHAAYYLRGLAEQEKRLKGEDQLGALETIDGAFENIRYGWQWAVAQRQADLIDAALDSLYWFCMIRSRFQESKDLLGFAKASFSENDGVIWVRILSRHEVYYYEPSPAVKAELVEALKIAEMLGAEADVAYCRMQLGMLKLNHEQYVAAFEHLSAARVIFEKMDEQFHLAQVYYGIGTYYWYVGEIDSVVVPLEKSLQIRRELGDLNGVAKSLYQLGNIHITFLGEIEAARGYNEEVLELSERLNNREGAVLGLTHLGYIHYLDGDMDKLREAAQEANRIAKDINSPIALGRAQSLWGNVEMGEENFEAALEAFQLGRKSVDVTMYPMLDVGVAFAYAGMGEGENSLRLLLQALRAGIEMKSPGYTFLGLGAAAVILAETHTPERSLELMVVALDFFGKGDMEDGIEWLDRFLPMKRLNDYILSQLSPVEYRTVWENTRKRNLDAVSKEVIAELETILSITALPTASPNEQLIEPLTERELEVLGLIAQGLSNAEIADVLVVGVSTVKKHINNMYSKLDVKSRTQAMVRAQELHLLD